MYGGKSVSLKINTRITCVKTVCFCLARVFVCGVPNEDWTHCCNKDLWAWLTVSDAMPQIWTPSKDNTYYAYGNNCLSDYLLNTLTAKHELYIVVGSFYYDVNYELSRANNEFIWSYKSTHHFFIDYYKVGVWRRIFESTSSSQRINHWFTVRWSQAWHCQIRTSYCSNRLWDEIVDLCLEWGTLSNRWLIEVLQSKIS